VQALRQAQCRHFSRLSAGNSAGSVQAIRQAQCRQFGRLSPNGDLGQAEKRDPHPAPSAGSVRRSPKIYRF